MVRKGSVPTQNYPNGDQDKNTNKYMHPKGHSNIGNSSERANLRYAKNSPNNEENFQDTEVDKEIQKFKYKNYL